MTERPTTSEQFAEFFTAALPARDLNALCAEQVPDNNDQEEIPE